MERCLVLDTHVGEVTILDEPAYSFGSADNARTYGKEIRLGGDMPASVHGVCLEEKWSAVFGAGGGCSIVHGHSAVEVDGRLYLAVGDSLVRLNLATGAMEWSRRVDPATCFGVHWHPPRQALISHGELEISRFSLDGDELWRVSGADVFSETLRCLPEGIEAVDFNQARYLFDYQTGGLLYGT